MSCNKYDIFYLQDEITTRNSDFTAFYVTVTFLCILLTLNFIFEKLCKYANEVITIEEEEADCTYSVCCVETDPLSPLDLETIENTKKNAYIGLDSAIINIEDENLLEEKDSNIDDFMNLYNSSKSVDNNSPMGPKPTRNL